jgi:hypothetical protein
MIMKAADREGQVECRERWRRGHDAIGLINMDGQDEQDKNNLGFQIINAYPAYPVHPY